MAENKFFQSPLDQLIEESKNYELPSIPPAQSSAAQDDTAPPPKVEMGKAASSLKKNGLMPPQNLQPLFEEASAEFGVPMNVLAALAQQESSYNPLTVGQPTKWGRAKGLLQYIDPTAKSMGINPFDAKESIRAAAAQMRDRLDKGYSIQEVIGAHFAGDDRKQWGPKTAEYITSVMGKADKIGQGYRKGANPAQQSFDLSTIQSELDAKEPGRYKVLSPEEADRYQQRHDTAFPADPLGMAQDAMKQQPPSPLLPGSTMQPAPSPLTIENQRRVDAGIAPKDTRPKQTDGFFSATGKALSNVPENFKNSAGGIIRSVGEGIDDQTLVMNAQQAGVLKKMMDRGEIVMKRAGLSSVETPHFKDGRFAGTSELAAYIRQNADSLMTPDEAASITGMKPGPISQYGKGMSDQARKDMVQINPDGALAKYGSMIIGSTAEMIPALTAAVITKNPMTAMSIMGGQVYGQSYDRAREAGENPREAAAYATMQAAAEAIPEALPLHFILKPGQQFFKGILSAGAAEALQEGVTQAIQSGIDKGTIDPNMTWAEARQQIIDAMIVGAGAGGTMRAGLHGVEKALGGNAPQQAEQQAQPAPAAQPEQQAQPTNDNTSAQPAVPQEQPAQPAANEPPPLVVNRGADGAQQPAPPQDGPLQRSASKAVQTEGADRVVVQTPTGPVSGTMEGFDQGANGAWSARILGDDGQFYQYTDKDGVQIAPEAAPNTAAVAPNTTEEAPNTEAVPQLKTTEQTVPVDQPAPVDAPVEQPQAEAKPEEKPVEQPKPVEEPAVEPVVAVNPEQPKREEKRYEDMTEAELRERLKYIAGQAKKNGGWDKRLVEERKKIERAINSLTAAKTAEPVTAAKEISEPKPEPKAETKPEQPVEQPKVETGAATSTTPTGKWFGTQEKADAFIAKKGDENLVVVPISRSRFEIHEKVKEAAPVEQKAPEEVEPSSTGLREMGKGMASAIKDNFYQGWFDLLARKDGASSAFRGESRYRETRAAYDAGQIKSPEDLREFLNKPQQPAPAAVEQPADMPTVGQEVVLGKGRVQGTVSAIDPDKRRVAVKIGDRAELMSLDSFNARVKSAEEAAGQAEPEQQQKQEQPPETKPAPAPEPKPAPKPAPSGNTIFTDEMAEKARALIRSKLSQLNSGPDPELFQAGIVLAGYHIEKGARVFADFARAMLADMGESVRPYLKQWYLGVKFDPRGAGLTGMSSASVVEAFNVNDITAEQPAAQPAVQQEEQPKTLVDAFYQHLKDGTLPRDNNGLRKLVSEIDGAAVDNARLKQAQEDLEAAIARYARGLNELAVDDRQRFDMMLALYNQQPNLNIRTSTSIENQAYSTPAPLAYLGARLAGIGKQTKVYEPTAGNGLLLITSDPKNATANELDLHRFENLKAEGFDAIHGNALDAISSGAVVEKSKDAVIANPPFGSVKDDAGKPTKVKVDGYSLGQIDHLIAAEALKAMKDDGKATLILGANKVAGGVSTDDRIFFNWLYGRYNVTGHFELDGKLYSRQGASWPVRVITIHGRRSSDRVSPAPGTIQRVNTWDEVYGQFEQVLGAQNGPIQSGAAAGGATEQQAGNDAATAPAAHAGETGASGRGGRAGSDQGAGNERGAGARAAGNQGAGAPQELAGGNPELRPDERTNAQDQLEPGDNRDAAPASGRGERTQGADAAKPAGNALADADNAYQTKYVPRSSRKDEGVLVPINMAQPLQDALSALEDEVGDIDQFAAKELGYASVDELHDALMGLQVDSVASAIHQIKSRSKGVIIADQTGIGKGRQAASIIRWSARNGYVPVFVTVKPQLFTDMYNDLADIGTRDIEPLIMNSDEWISGPNGEKLFANKPSQHKKVLSDIAATGELPEGRNALFLTYSQINTDNVQRRVLGALAQRAVFILDESHNAGGESSTGIYMREMLDNVQGVTYLSATFAKRPDNMPVYFKTDIGAAIQDSGGLMDAMKQGGLPLQTVVSNNLVKAGQMFRRERSYDGVSIETKVDSANRVAHEQLSDKVTQALRAIVEADRMFHNGFVKRLQEELKKRGEELQDIAGNQASDSVNHTEFSSVVHNFVRQMLLGLKADTSAQEAIDAIKRGEKPLIALENTMGSFLNEYAENNDLRQGDDLGNFDYRTVLTRALDRTRYIVKVTGTGDKEKVYIDIGQLDSTTKAAYLAAQDVIDGLDMDIPVSPLDWIRYRIEQAGYSVAEITGRNLAVDYSSGRPKLSQVPLTEQNDKVDTTRRFNDGRLDAIILNVSGSTGISLHASEKFKDQRKRVMVIAQAAQDINIFMQMLGRVHRTGQVRLPGYIILNADLPAEKRPTALLNGKMKSLNANTSSNTESATSIKSADMLNKYGDQVIANYLADNPALADALDLHGELVDSNGNAQDDIARKATGRMALMPVQTQKDFYAEVEEQYSSLIEYLNDTNQNDLEPRTFDFEAELIGDAVLVEATDPKSPFGQEAVYGEYRIKAQGKQMTIEEIKAEAAKNLNGLNGGQHATALIEQLDKAMPTKDVTDTDIATQRNGQTFIREHSIGTPWRVEINGDIYNAVVTNIRSTHKKTGNPYSLSKTQVTLAVNGPLRSVTVPASQWKRIEVAPLSRVSLQAMFGEQVEGSEKAKIITGNLLAAYGELKDSKGTIISFTKKDGTIEQGILLPKKFDYQLNTRGDFQFRSAEDAVKFLTTSREQATDRFGIATRDGAVRVLPSGTGVKIIVPKSKARGGKYFLDKRLTAITGDFVSSSDGMIVALGEKRSLEAVRYLMTKAPLYASPSLVDDARKILGLPPLDRTAQDGTAPKARYSVAGDQVKRAVTRGELGEVVGRLIDKGQVVIHEDTSTLPEGMGQGISGVQAATAPDGKIHLVASNLAAGAAQGALFHEAFHTGAKALIGSKPWDALLARLDGLMRQAEKSTGKAREFFDRAAARVATAQQQGGVAAGLEAEEFGAYAVEEWDNAPASISKWAHDVVGAVKAWVLRRFGAQLGQVTPAQLRALAREALRSNKTTPPINGSRYSVLDEKTALEDATKALDEEPQYKPDFIGELRQDIGRIAKMILHPRQIAALHAPFTPVYQTAINQFEMRDSIIDELQRDHKSYDVLPNESKRRVNAALELGRLLSDTYTAEQLRSGVVNPGVKTVVRFTDGGSTYRTKEKIHPTLSAAGEVVKLNEDEIQAYLGLRSMFDNALDKFRDQTLVDFGFPELVGKKDAGKAIMDMIGDATPAAKKERMEGVARFIREIEQAKRTGYVPFARFGDYVVAVKEQQFPLKLIHDSDSGGWITRDLPEPYNKFLEGIGAKWDELEGGYRLDRNMREALVKENERTIYSQKVEFTLQDKALIKMGRPVRELPSVRKALAEAEKWKAGNPNRRIVSFDAIQKKPEGGVKLSDVDALAEVAMLNTETWDAVRDQLADAIKGQSFRKHFFQADNVPGYSEDFERAIADYMAGMAGYLSRRHYNRAWDDALADIKAPRLFEYATKYREYANNPQEELATLRQIGFFHYIAGVPATAFINLTQPFIMTIPALSQIAPHATVLREMGRAYKDALAMVRMSKRVGLDFFDPNKAPADIRESLKKAWAEGMFVPLQTYEVMATSRSRNVGGRQAAKLFNKTVQATAALFSFAERLNRMVTFIASARLSDKPGVKERAQQVYGRNALARQTFLKDWHQGSVADFFIDETQFRMGKANRPGVSRGIGAALMQFKGFMMQSLETWFRLATQNGAQGAKAVAMSIGAMVLIGGVWGLPGADDLRDLIEKAYKQVTKQDLDLKTDLRKGLYDLTGQRWIAELASKGATYPLGLDLSRVGMGNIAPDTPVQVFGIPADLFIGRPTRAFQKASGGDPVGAIGEFLPNFLKNPATAYSWKQNGVRDSAGRLLLGSEDVTGADAALKSVGFQPSHITNVRDYEYAQRRMETANDALKRDYVSKLAKTIARAEKDPEHADKYMAEHDQLLSEIDAHNEKAGDEGRINITRAALNNAIKREMGGVEMTWGKERKQARGASEGLRDVFGLSKE